MYNKLFEFINNLKLKKMKLNQKEQLLLEERGYEYLDGQWCYAKVGKNIAIKQSEKNNFYVEFTKDQYSRGKNFDAGSGVTVTYFKTIEEVFKIIDILEKYAIS